MVKQNNQKRILFLTSRKEFVNKIQQKALNFADSKGQSLQYKLEFITDKNIFKKQLDINKILGRFDLIIVYSFRAIIPKNVIEFLEQNNIPILNVHFSLLPQFPGALPIQATLLSQKTDFGITIHKLVEKVDAGDIFMQIQVDHNLLGYSAFDIFNDLEQVFIALFKEFLTSKGGILPSKDRLQQTFNNLPNFANVPDKGKGIQIKYYPANTKQNTWIQAISDPKNYKPQRTEKFYANYAPFSLANNINVSFLDFKKLTANEIVARVRAFYREPIARANVKFLNRETVLLLHKVFPIDSNAMYRLGSRIITSDPEVCRAMKLLKRLNSQGVINLNRIKPGQVLFVKKAGLVAGTYLGPVYIYEAGLQNKKVLKGVELLSLKGKLQEFI